MATGPQLCHLLELTGFPEDHGEITVAAIELGQKYSLHGIRADDYQSLPRSNSVPLPTHPLEPPSKLETLAPHYLQLDQVPYYNIEISYFGFWSSEYSSKSISGEVTVKVSFCLVINENRGSNTRTKWRKNVCDVGGMCVPAGPQGNTC